MHRPAVRLLRTAALAFAVAFGVYAVAAQRHDIATALHDVGVVAPLLAFVAVLAGLGMSGLAWRALLGDLGVALSLPAVARVFFVGQVGKYLPGGVWPVLAQMELGRDEGAARRQVGTVALLVMVVNVVTGLLVAAAVLPFTSTHALHRYGWALVAVPAGLALLHPRVLGAVVSRALRVLRREPLPHLPTARGVVAAVGWSLAMWGCYGAHVYALSAALTGTGHRLPALATGGYALAWAVGLLVLVAPAGAGAREAVLVLALAPALSTAAATTVALLSRALMTAADLAWAGVGVLAGRAPRGEPDPPGVPASDSRGTSRSSRPV